MKRLKGMSRIVITGPIWRGATICLLLLAVFRLPVLAEPLTLDRCLDIAGNKNPDIARAEAAKNEAEMKLKVARAGYYPEMAVDILSGYKSRVNTTEQDDITVRVSPDMPPLTIPGPSFDLGDKKQHDLALTLRQPIYTGGRVKNGIRLSEAALSAAESQEELQKRDIRHDVINAFYQLAMAEAFEKIARGSKKQIDSHLADAQNLLSQGMIIKSDLYPIKIRQLETDLNVVEAENAIARAKASLAAVMGLSPKAPIDILVDWEQHPPWPVPETIKSFPMKRTEQKITDQQIAMAAAEQNIARGARLPAVGLTASTHYGWPGFISNDPGWDTWWQAGVNVTWPVFDMGRRRHEHMAAREKIRRLDKAAQALDRQIELDRINCRLAYEEACRKRIINEEKVASARENYQTKSDNFRVGMASGTDYLDAHTELMTAETDLSIATVRARVAWADYLKAMGIELNIDPKESPSSSSSRPVERSGT